MSEKIQSSPVHINEPFLICPSHFEQFLLEEEQARVKAISLFTSTRDGIMSVDGDVATISIKGVLRSSAPILSWSSWTIYSDILAALHVAEATPSVRKIILAIDSPGGDVAGLDSVASQIRESKKNTVAHVDNLAASAAYWLASQADKIIATSPTARFGSIGVVQRVVDWTKFDANFGIITHTIVSTKSPKKVPDPATEGGRDQIRSELDDLLDVFVTRVADGRRVDKEKVYSDFGQGDVLIAEKASSIGMIDQVLWNNSVKQERTVEAIIEKKENAKKQPLKETSMSEKTYTDGVAVGIQQERTRVTRLIGWLDTEGASGLAMDAIRSGQCENDIMGQLVRASHLPSEAIHRQAENVPDVDTSTHESSAESEEKRVANAAAAILKHSAEVRNV